MFYGLLFQINLKKKKKESTKHTWQRQQTELPTLMVTLPLVIFLMLNPTVGIMSSLNWPDWKTQRKVQLYKDYIIKGAESNSDIIHWLVKFIWKV